MSVASMVLLSLLIVHQASARTWRSRSNTLEADLVQIEGDKAVLKRTKDGKIITISLRQFSDNDRTYLASQGKTSTSKPMPAVALSASAKEAQTKLCEAIRDQALKARRERAEAKKLLTDAGIKLGTWRRIGPFRDQGPLINWMDNVASSFTHEFQVAKDTKANGNAPLFKKVYPSPNFPATPNAIRRWEAQPEWIDGYYQELPRGPAPSSGESQFVYRTITVSKDVEATIHLLLRSPEADRRMDGKGMEHWRRTGRYYCTLNGKEVFKWEGQRDMQVPQKVTLKAGVNHLFAKITNNRHAYGFAFSIHGLHPELRREIGFERGWRPFRIDAATDVPLFGDAPEKPSWYVKKATWMETFKACLAEPRSKAQILEDFSGKEYPKGWRVEGTAFGKGPERGMASTRRREKEVGKLTSPIYTVKFPYLQMRIAGQRAKHVKKKGKKKKAQTVTVVKTVALRVFTIDKNGKRTQVVEVDGGNHRDHDVEINLAKVVGQKIQLEIEDMDKGRGGWINVDYITLSAMKKKEAKEQDALWALLRSKATSPSDRQTIGILESLCSPSWMDVAKSKSPSAMLYQRLNTMLGSLGVRDRKLTTAAIGQPTDDLEFVLNGAKIIRYANALARMQDLRYHPKPMPGVETAALDSAGRVVPAMEKALEKHPRSALGRRHEKRLQELQKIVEPLLTSLTRGGDPQFDGVLKAGDAIDGLWMATARELPELMFLERPTYRHDAIQFTASGGRPAYVRTLNCSSGKVKTIYHNPGISVHEISQSFDGKTLYLSGGKAIYRVGVDGSNFKRIAVGQSGAEMPDGRIVFFDDDVGQSPCKGGGPRRLLFICDPDGSNRKVVSANLTIDNSPTVMNDGRIIFARWDYGVNKNVFNRHALWVQNPDGTGIDLFFGNTVIDPRGFYRPRQVPGRPEVICVFGPHHANVAGLVGLVWPGEGKEAADGLGFRRLSDDTASIGDSAPTYSFQDPHPLNEQLFLVSYGGNKARQVGLYLIDRSGNRKCLYRPGKNGFGAHSAHTFGPRKRPMVIPDRTQTPNWTARVDLHKRLLSDPDWSQKSTLILQDVYQGIEPEIKRGRAKYLAVMEQVTQSHGRGGSIGVGTIWYANRFIGLVPIEEDGSAHFEVPALRSLYFHVLDAQGRMLMTQGSDFHTMPGEVRSCIGCHESRKGIDAPPNTGKRPIAASKPPVRPKLPGWGTRGIIEYEASVQPVFDKYCIKCHSGKAPKAKLDLTGSSTTVYNMSYMQLTDKRLVHFTPGSGRTHAQPSNDSDEQAPLSRGSLLSKAMKSLEDPKHSGKEIPFKDRLSVYLWIDSNVPFYSHYRQKSPTVLKEPARKKLADIHKRRCASCHNQPNRPDEKSGLNIYHTWVHTGGRPGQWGIADSGMRVHHLNLTKPETSATLLAPLSKKAGGWGTCDKSGKSVFTSTSDPDYKTILDILRTQVEKRDMPGVKKLLSGGKLSKK